MRPFRYEGAMFPVWGEASLTGQLVGTVVPTRCDRDRGKPTRGETMGKKRKAGKHLPSLYEEFTAAAAERVYG
jgi:hypothetical protein